LFAGGTVSSNGDQNVVDYVTIASTGNAQDFGDLSTATRFATAVSNKTLALHHASGDSVSTNRLDKFTIASTGNPTDWGDLASVNYNSFSASNSHGGIA